MGLGMGSVYRPGPVPPLHAPHPAPSPAHAQICVLYSRAPPLVRLHYERAGASPARASAILPLQRGGRGGDVGGLVRLCGRAAFWQGQTWCYTAQHGKQGPPPGRGDPLRTSARPWDLPGARDRPLRGPVPVPSERSHGCALVHAVSVTAERGGRSGERSTESPTPHGSPAEPPHRVHTTAGHSPVRVSYSYPSICGSNASIACCWPGASAHSRFACCISCTQIVADSCAWTALPWYSFVDSLHLAFSGKLRLEMVPEWADGCPGSRPRTLVEESRGRWPARSNSCATKGRTCRCSCRGICACTACPARPRRPPSVCTSRRVDAGAPERLPHTNVCVHGLARKSASRTP